VVTKNNWVGNFLRQLYRRDLGCIAINSCSKPHSRIIAQCNGPRMYCLPWFQHLPLCKRTISCIDSAAFQSSLLSPLLCKTFFRINYFICGTQLGRFSFLRSAKMKSSRIASPFHRENIREMRNFSKNFIKRLPCPYQFRQLVAKSFFPVRHAITSLPEIFLSCFKFQICSTSFLSGKDFPLMRRLPSETLLWKLFCQVFFERWEIFLLRTFPTSPWW